MMWTLSKLLMCVCIWKITQCQGQGWVIKDHGCRTPDRDIGDCRPIMQCEPITNFMRTLLKRPLTKEVISYLNSHTCSYESSQVWVCCPPGPISFREKGDSDYANAEPPDVSQHRNYHLLPEECGYLDAGDRIRGGVNAKLNEFPWMALLSYKTERGPDFRCGGTIINERYILTAGHCLHNLNYPLLGVRVGEYNIQTKIDCELTRKNEQKCSEPVQDLVIEEILVHPGFNGTVIQNDIGLLRVSRMNLTVANVRPVCLPVDTARGTDLNGKQIIVTGWGADATGHTSMILQKVELPIVDLTECQNIYKAENRAKISIKQLCAGGRNRKDSCRGDSGGPMQTAAYINGDTRYVQQGVVSFGPAYCGLEGYPGVYTRVEFYMDWVLDIMKP
ncbi:unnamed protein product [Phaedon cochleariae]|uniref:CLIP domain-containing serine protease n=1 Tax=Phaedon cochleariae TaxID=80249 RepID=A0A9P0DH37_PHACE|nr:unnamed protein product [Phaedon cochleariae]